MNFYKLKVKEVRRETEDTVSVSFDIPGEAKDSFNFTQGQYLTFKRSIKGEEIRRSYSICTAPSDNDLRVAIKQIPNGLFSTFANQELKAGDELETMTPTGNFNTPIDAGNQKNYALFASGSGITPILSIAKTVLKEEPNSTVNLYYGNKSSDSTIFKAEIDQLQNDFSSRLNVHYFFSRQAASNHLNEGRLDHDKVKAISGALLDPKAVSEAFICGPESMIHGVSDALFELGVDKNHIHYELFTTPSQNMESLTPTSKTKEGTSQVTVVIDGDEFDFEMDYNDGNILDFAIDEGADLPFSCKGGVCCTCKAKVVEGEVEMEVNYALEKDEVEQGYVLGCQSHPRSERVIIDFDER